MVKTVLDQEDKDKILQWVQSHGDGDPVTWAEFKLFLKFLRDVLFADPEGEP